MGLYKGGHPRRSIRFTAAFGGAADMDYGRERVFDAIERDWRLTDRTITARNDAGSIVERHTIPPETLLREEGNKIAQTISSNVGVSRSSSAGAFSRFTQKDL
jgi:hypothetical protein